MSGRYLNYDPENGSPGHDRLVLWIQKHGPKWLKEHIETPAHRWGESRRGLLAQTDQLLADRQREAENLAGQIARLQDAASQDTGSGSWREATLKRITSGLSQLQTAIRTLENLHLNIDAVPPAIPPRYTFELEHVIGGGRGYIDALGTVTYPLWDWCLSHGNGYLDKINQVPYMQESTTERMAAFEAKLSIPSLGALLRQLRFYQDRFGTYWTRESGNMRLPYVVVSPDTHYRAQIEQQGFFFWQAPPME